MQLFGKWTSGYELSACLCARLSVSLTLSLTTTTLHSVYRPPPVEVCVGGGGRVCHSVSSTEINEILKYSLVRKPPDKTINANILNRKLLVIFLTQFRF